MRRSLCALVDVVDQAAVGPVGLALGQRDVVDHAVVAPVALRHHHLEQQQQHI